MLFDEEMMLLAIEEAKKAPAHGDIPVGAVITDENGSVIAKGHNTREADGSPTAHAEINAILRAAEALGTRRLSGCTLYVTLEPCPMCAGAVINARLRRLVYGAFDESMGACASVTRLLDKNFGYKPLVRSRVLPERCAQLMTDFFKDIRDKGKDKSENENRP